MTYNKNLRGVTYPSNFILNIVVNTLKKNFINPHQSLFCLQQHKEKSFVLHFHIKKHKIKTKKIMYLPFSYLTSLTNLLTNLLT
jgi:hypothetical protein